MEDLAGRDIGQYHLVAQIGRGGMAGVYRAYQSTLNRYVAIKVLQAQADEQPEFFRRFRQEAQAIASLRHPNILTVHDFGEEGGLAYIVMEYVPGGTLKDRLGLPMPPAHACRLVAQVALALDYAHGRGIIHRDVKPANILMPAEEWALLSDFGIAKIVGRPQTLTQPGVGLGTPEYMSPEQSQGLLVDGRSDIYSLGIVLYESLTGRTPFSADTPVAVALHHAYDPPPQPRSIVPHLSEALERIVLRTIAKRPEDRFQTAGELAEALEAVARPTLIVPRSLATANTERNSPGPITPKALPIANSSGRADPDEPTYADEIVVPSRPKPRSRMLVRAVLGGILLLICIGGLGYYAFARNLLSTGAGTPIAGVVIPGATTTPTAIPATPKPGTVVLPTPTPTGSAIHPTPTVRRTTPTATPTPGMKTFRSTALPYSMSYPSTWTVQGGVPVGQVLGDVYKSDVVGAFVANVNVVTEKNLSARTDSEDYLQSNLEQIRKLLSVEPKLERSLTVDEQDAFWISYSYQGHTVNQVLFVARRTGWVITLTTNPDETDGYLPVFRQMLGTFRLNR